MPVFGTAMTTDFSPSIAKIVFVVVERVLIGVNGNLSDQPSDFLWGNQPFVSKVIVHGTVHYLTQADVEELHLQSIFFNRDKGLGLLCQTRQESERERGEREKERERERNREDLSCFAASEIRPFKRLFFAPTGISSGCPSQRCSWSVCKFYPGDKQLIQIWGVFALRGHMLVPEQCWLFIYWCFCTDISAQTVVQRHAVS